MEHKAFLFEFEQFEHELLPILQAALATNDCAELVAFIRRSVASLKDPYEGAPLKEGWQTMIETPDAHQYGDIALTKYYDPADDRGLGSSWEQIQTIVASDPGVHISPILGSVIEKSNAVFDPGKMGSYFQNGEASEGQPVVFAAPCRQGADGRVVRSNRSTGASRGSEKGTLRDVLAARSIRSSSIWIDRAAQEGGRNSTMIPERIHRLLADGGYSPRLDDKNYLRRNLIELGIDPQSEIGSFYLEYDPSLLRCNTSHEQLEDVTGANLDGAPPLQIAPWETPVGNGNEIRSPCLGRAELPDMPYDNGG